MADKADARAKDDKEGKDSKDPDARPLEESEVTTQHSLSRAGVRFDYTAKVGRIVLHDDGEQAKPKVALFYTSYCREGVEDGRNRPLVFLWNGGPGSSSIWLHLYSVGPRRIVFEQDPLYDTSRWELQTNEHTLLDVADLVFVDPPSTGFSRVAPGEDPKQFYGVDGDAAVIADFITEFVSRNGRWESPIVLAGESYGTVRAPAVAEQLQRKPGLSVDGIVLISSIMDLAGVAFNVGVNLGAVAYLPSYAATALFHGRTSGDLEQVVAEAEGFAVDEYSVALLKGTRLSESERERIAGRVAELSGISKEFVLRSNLRVPLHRYVKELLRERRRTVGRLDGRWQGIDADAAGETFSHDPSMSMVTDPATRAWNQHVRADLGWLGEPGLTYRTMASLGGWKHRGTDEQHGMWTPHLEVATSLRNVMNRAPHVKVLLQSGYYDFATPYFAAEMTFDHLFFEAERAQNITTRRYESGHMMYLHEPSLVAMREDLGVFLSALRP